MLVMKKWIWLIVIIVVSIFGFIFSYTVNSETKGVISKNNNDFLKLVLQIDGEIIKGKVNSIIIPTKELLFFFGDNGKCIKKIKLQKDSGPDIYKLSRNKKYLAIREISNKSFILNIYSYSGKSLWNKEFEVPFSVLGISNDAKRVLVRLSTQKDNDYPVIQYLDEVGQEIASIDGLEVVQIGQEYAISDNGRYWVCSNKYGQNPDKWFFYDYLGHRIREKKIQGEYLKTIADNGNYLIESNMGKTRKLILNNWDGQIVKEYSDKEVYLSKDGKVIFFIDDNNFIFEEQDHKHEILFKMIEEKVENRQLVLSRVLSNFSFNGSCIVTKLEQIDDYTLIFIYKNEEIKVTSSDITEFGNIYKARHELIDLDKLFGIWNSDFTKLKLYSIGGETK